jgi:hypothetical protein
MSERFRWARPAPGWVRAGRAPQAAGPHGRQAGGAGFASCRSATRVPRRAITGWQSLAGAGNGRRSGAARRLRGVSVVSGLLASSGLLALTLSTPASASAPASAQTTQTPQTIWTITPGPTSGYGMLSDVYAASPASAWAVGQQGGGGPAPLNQLIEHWNGGNWQVATVPVVSQFSTRLLSVSGTSASDIWAVGDQETSNLGPYPPEVTLIMHWDGSSWTRVPSPNPGAFVSRLIVVKAFGPSDVWASGFFQNSDTQMATDMTLHWNGSSWSQVSMPDPSMMVAGGTSGTDVWFMGATPWHFNGSSFTQVPGPVSHEIVATSASGAWGLASDLNGNSVLNHWNRSAWSTFQTLPASDSLSGLVALSASDVWAVGEVWLANGNSATLTMRWNGSTWTTVSSPNPPQSSFPALNAAAAAAPGTVLAVGIGSGTSSNQTLAMVTTSG